MLVTGGAFVSLWTRYGLSVALALTGIYTAVLVLMLVTDLEQRSIFTIVLLPAIVLAVLAGPFSPLGWERSVLGGVIAFVLVFAIYVLAGLYARMRKLRIAGGAFGRGDVILATFVGVITGFPAVFYALVYTIFLAGFGVLVFLAYQMIVHRRLALSAVIPYGPFFCIAGWFVMSVMS